MGDALTIFIIHIVYFDANLMCEYVATIAYELQTLNDTTKWYTWKRKGRIKKSKRKKEEIKTKIKKTSKKKKKIEIYKNDCKHTIT